MRSYGFAITYGSDTATVTVQQDGTPVTYDCSSMVTAYKQITSQSCATTCAGMCVNVSPASLQSAGFDLDSADWTGIGSKYGYSVTTSSSASLSSIYRTLASGYPVIVKVNNTSSGQHWVTVTRYSGSSITSLITANKFICIDPYDGTSKALTNATNYAGVYYSVVYKKN